MRNSLESRPGTTTLEEAHMAERRLSRPASLAALVTLGLAVAACSGPTPSAEPAGAYTPIPAGVETVEASLRETFEMSPQETHEYWENPEAFNLEPILNYVDTDGSVGEHGGDTPTGALVPPSNGLDVSEDGRGLGDEAEGVPYQPGGVGEGATGRLYIAFPGDEHGVCSGTVVNSDAGNIVATAAHCIWDSSAEERAVNTLFIPADSDNGANRPYGTWSATEVIYSEIFREEALVDPTISGEGWAYDVAFLIMEENDQGQNIQEVTGAMGIAFGVPNETLVSTGYPTRDPYDGTDRFYCSTSSYDLGMFGGYYWPCDMTPGMSGGGVFAYYDDATDAGYLVAVNSLVSQDSQGNVTHTESSALGEVALDLYTQAGGYGNVDQE